MSRKRNEKGTFLVNNLLNGNNGFVLPSSYRNHSNGGVIATPFVDDFGGTAGEAIASAPVGSNWTLYDWYAENNAGAPAWDELGTVNGRLRIRIQDNAGNSGNGKSLIWRTGGVDYYGAILYQILTPPFDVAVYGCRVASQDDPDTLVPAMTSGEFALVGLAARHPDLTADYEHCVIGYRAGQETLEWKRRSGATGISQDDVGAFSSNLPQGDVRLSMAADGSRTWYYRETIGSGPWTELVTDWNFVAEPDLLNDDGQVAVCLTGYAFDNFVPDAGYYIQETVNLG